MIAWVQGRARAVSGSQGGGDLRTLTRAEWMGGLRPLRGEALMSGFYLNELVQKLVARDDPHEALFDAYLQALSVLSEERPAAPVLRHFEVALLREAGYALRLGHAADGSRIEPLSGGEFRRERPFLKNKDRDLMFADFKYQLRARRLFEITDSSADQIEGGALQFGQIESERNFPRKPRLHGMAIGGDDVHRRRTR